MVLMATVSPENDAVEGGGAGGATQAIRALISQYLPHLGLPHLGGAKGDSSETETVAGNGEAEAVKAAPSSTRDIERGPRQKLRRSSVYSGDVIFPRNLFSFVLSTTVASVMTAIPGMAFIVMGDYAIDALSSLADTAQPGPVSDVHSIQCMMCISLVEFALAALVRFEWNYMRLKVVQWPSHAVLFLLGSKIIFNWHPGEWWASVLTTVTYALSFQVTFPFLKKRINFFTFLLVNCGYAIFIHQSVMALVYVHVIVTRELAQRDEQLATIFASGVFFPLVSFLVRRGVIAQIYKMEVRRCLGAGSEVKETEAEFLTRVCLLRSCRWNPFAPEKFSIRGSQRDTIGS